MQLSVVMVTFNSAACIGGALRAVKAELPSAQAIVVDNGSTDETVATVTEVSPETKIVSGQGNVGFGAACNLGVAAATNSHVLLMNPDVRIVSADTEALEELAGGPRLGLVAPLIAADGVETPRHQLFRERNWVVESLDHVAGSLWPRGLMRGRPFAAPGDEGWASGAALLVRRDEFQRVGGFDERLFLFYEDRDLSMRYRQAGLPVRGTDALTGRHAGGESSAQDTLEAFRLACAVLGWVEYTAKWGGERRARAAARLMLVTLTAVQAISAVGAIGGSPRFVRKGQQLAALRRILRGGALDLPPERYPAARRLLARRSASGGRRPVPGREPEPEAEHERSEGEAIHREERRQRR
jgi:N-acetylglucosaminyl-diphospho-decaprenol L-rhamnosyltransferase